MRTTRRAAITGAAALAGGLTMGAARKADHYRVTGDNVRGETVTQEVIVRGRGPLVIMVPSLGRGAEDFDDLSLRVAAAGFTAAAVNPLGIGDSTGPAAKTMAELAENLAAAVRNLASVSALRDTTDRPDGSTIVPSYDKAVLIGHAFGNRVVRATAAAHPELVSGLILLAAGGQVSPAPDIAKALADVFEDLPDAAHMEAVRKGFFAPGNDPAVWRGGWYPAVARAQQAALRATPPDTWQGGGTAPILVVQAEDDAIAPPANAEALVRAYPGRVRVVTLLHAGHAMLPEQPARIAEIVIEYLKSRPA